MLTKCSGCMQPAVEHFQPIIGLCVDEWFVYCLPSQKNISQIIDVFDCTVCLVCHGRSVQHPRFLSLTWVSFFSRRFHLRMSSGGTGCKERGCGFCEVWILVCEVWILALGLRLLGSERIKIQNLIHFWFSVTRFQKSRLRHTITCKTGLKDYFSQFKWRVNNFRLIGHPQVLLRGTDLIWTFLFFLYFCAHVK